MPIQDSGGRVDVQILVLGDGKRFFLQFILLFSLDGVGKTSLIMALVEDAFCSDVPARIDRVIIPPDVSPERVVTSIVDYSGKFLKCSKNCFICILAREQSEADLLSEIRSSNVICLVYAVDNEKSVERV